MNSKIEEVRIRKVDDLSSAAQTEVIKKLREKGSDFNYKGYAAVSYEKQSPLSIVGVDPIEGTSIDYFRSIIPK